MRRLLSVLLSKDEWRLNSSTPLLATSHGAYAVMRLHARSLAQDTQHVMLRIGEARHSRVNSWCSARARQQHALARRNCLERFTACSGAICLLFVLRGLCPRCCVLLALHCDAGRKHGVDDFTCLHLHSAKDPASNAFRAFGCFWCQMAW